MNFNYKLTEKVKEFIVDAKLEEISIGYSDSQVFKIEKLDKIYFIKISSKGRLTSEYEKLKWLEGKLNVPKIVLYDYTDDTEYLITESVEGEMICSAYYLNNHKIGIKVIAEAFKHINKVNIEDCPFDVSNDYKLSLVENNVKNNLIHLENLKEETLKKFGILENIVKFLKDNKFDDGYCFSHGNTSLPNIFALDNKFTGVIDVGECDIADMWFDLAICEKLIRRNYGEQYVSKFYEELNIIPERDKIEYYLLMMELYL